MRVELKRTVTSQGVLDEQDYILIEGTKGYIETMLDGHTLRAQMDWAIKPLAGAIGIANMEFGVAAEDLKMVE